MTTKYVLGHDSIIYKPSLTILPIMIKWWGQRSAPLWHHDVTSPVIVQHYVRNRKGNSDHIPRNWIGWWTNREVPMLVSALSQSFHSVICLLTPVLFMERSQVSHTTQRQQHFKQTSRGWGGGIFFLLACFLPHSVAPSIPGMKGKGGVPTY